MLLWINFPALSITIFVTLIYFLWSRSRKNTITVYLNIQEYISMEIIHYLSITLLIKWFSVSLTTLQNTKYFTKNNIENLLIQHQNRVDRFIISHSITIFSSYTYIAVLEYLVITYYSIKLTMYHYLLINQSNHWINKTLMIKLLKLLKFLKTLVN